MIRLHLTAGLLRVEFTRGEPVPEDEAQASIVPTTSGTARPAASPSAGTQAGPSEDRLTSSGGLAYTGDVVTYLQPAERA